MSLPAKVRPIKAVQSDTYHGIPVLNLRVDDSIPTPRAPERSAVRVYPDLARYLLTFNHNNNRGIKTRTVQRYASDMGAGLWRFTPEPIIWSQVPELNNGQHRLHAVIEYGGDVWMMMDFGWPDEIINAIDRGAGRTNSDALSIVGVANYTRIAAAISLVDKYRQVLALGGHRSFTSLPTPSAQAALVIYETAPEAWNEAARVGGYVYKALDYGFGVATWVAAHRIITEAHPDKATPFMEAVANGLDPAKSASRQLADWARRRPNGATRTGDTREPLEVVIRGFNAWNAGKPLAFPKFAGFQLSRVR